MSCTNDDEWLKLKCAFGMQKWFDLNLILVKTIFFDKKQKNAIFENSLTDMMLFQCAFFLLSHARLNSFRTLKNHFGGAFTKKCNRCSSHYSTYFLITMCRGSTNPVWTIFKKKKKITINRYFLQRHSIFFFFLKKKKDYLITWMIVDI